MADMLESEEGQRFFQLVHMLQRSALMNLGAIADGEGMIHFNLGEAKEAIDLLGTLEKRTAGNLSDTESGMLRSVLGDLRMRFVRAPADEAKVKEEMARQEKLKSMFTDPAAAPADTLIDDESE